MGSHRQKVSSLKNSFMLLFIKTLMMTFPDRSWPLLPSSSGVEVDLSLLKPRFLKGEIDFFCNSFEIHYFFQIAGIRKVIYGHGRSFGQKFC